MKVLSVEETRILENKLVKEYNIPPLLLMENAGAQSFNLLKEKINLKDKRICVLCGPGNNGGDALVIARYLYMNGITPTVFLYNWDKNISELSKIQYEILKNTEIEFLSLREEYRSIRFFDIIIDGLLGIGLKRPLDNELVSIIEEVNKLNKTVISIDVPTGIDADSGKIMGACIKANYTVTMFLPKIGFFNPKVIDYIGELAVNPLGFPIKFLNNLIPSNIYYVQEEDILESIPKFSLGVHKGEKGKVLIIGGSLQYSGAPILSAKSALRTSAGLVYLALPESISNLHRGQNPEIIFIPLEDKSGYISYESVDKILEIIEKLRIDSVGIGPGIGLFGDTQRFIQELVLKIDKPLVIDADALTAIKPILSYLNKGNIIITPHIGEMSRLTDLSIEHILENRIDVSRKFAEKYNINLILKGPYSLSVFPDGDVYINPFASSLLATAGSGDVLTGILTALLAQGISIKKACVLGNYVHSLSSLIYKETIGDRGLIAGDIVENIPLAFKKIIENS